MDDEEVGEDDAKYFEGVALGPPDTLPSTALLPVSPFSILDDFDSLVAAPAPPVAVPRAGRRDFLYMLLSWTLEPFASSTSLLPRTADKNDMLTRAM